ncbi:phage holin family protein [Sphingomonas adhaesiva]|uniref:phage holin family protein n=1 Tax=Sphingomonas adhaesiva TaxID=28212 RepID=UPI002FF8BA0E
MDLREPVLDDRSIPHLVSRLTGDAREVARAEIALAKAKAGAAVTRYRTAAIYFAVAGVLALAALIALLVGLILSLATLVGPGFATLIVIGATLAAAAALAFAGKSRLSR